jgi:protein-tyrosine phosphatase
MNGTMAWSSVCFLMPYLAITWLLWQLERTISKESVRDEVIPGLWLGRRCSAEELPESVGLVVDLTAEFPEPADVRTGREYICVPTLDASVPSMEAFQAVVQKIAESPKVVYVHCALGHGRSATVVAAVLMARGFASTVDEAIRMVRERRPGIDINGRQKTCLDGWASATHHAQATE